VRIKSTELMSPPLWASVVKNLRVSKTALVRSSGMVILDSRYLVTRDVVARFDVIELASLVPHVFSDSSEAAWSDQLIHPAWTGHAAKSGDIESLDSGARTLVVVIGAATDKVARSSVYLEDAPLQEFNFGLRLDGRDFPYWHLGFLIY
jgi:hypothetical protein